MGQCKCLPRASEVKPLLVLESLAFGYIFQVRFQKNTYSSIYIRNRQGVLITAILQYKQCISYFRCWMRCVSNSRTRSNQCGMYADFLTTCTTFHLKMSCMVTTASMLFNLNSFQKSSVISLQRTSVVLSCLKSMRYFDSRRTFSLFLIYFHPEEYVSKFEAHFRQEPLHVGE